MVEEDKLSKERKVNKGKKQDKPKKRGVIGKFFMVFVDVKRWVSYDELVGYSNNAVELFKKLFTRQTLETREESYEEAVARMSLSEQQLRARKQVLLHSALIYLGVALVFIAYLIYLLANLKWMAAFLMVILVTLLMLLAYREHFWYMQMKKKRLGCSFRDWLEFAFKLKIK